MKISQRGKIEAPALDIADCSGYNGVVDLAMRLETQMRNGLLALAALVLVTANAQAAFLARFDFTGETGTQFSTTAADVAAGISQNDSLIRRSPTGLTPADGDGSINSSGWTDAATPNLAEDYYAIIITAEAGNSFTLESIAFGEQRTGNGPTNFSIITNVAGGTVTPSQYVVTSTAPHDQTITFSGSEFSGLTSVEIRIYGYGNEGGERENPEDGTYRLTNLTDRPVGEPNDGLFVNGFVGPAVTPVPGPASFGLLALGAPALLLVRRRAK